MCGINDDLESSDMKLLATFDPQYISLNSLDFNDGNNEYDTCFYEIEHYIDEQTWDQLKE